MFRTFTARHDDRQRHRRHRYDDRQRHDDRQRYDDRQRHRTEHLKNELQQSLRHIQSLEYRLQLTTRNVEQLRQRNLELNNSCRDLLDDSENDAKKRKSAERKIIKAKKSAKKLVNLLLLLNLNLIC